MCLFISLFFYLSVYRSLSRCLSRSLLRSPMKYLSRSPPLSFPISLQERDRECKSIKNHWFSRVCLNAVTEGVQRVCCLSVVGHCCVQFLSFLLSSLLYRSFFSSARGWLALFSSVPVLPYSPIPFS